MPLEAVQESELTGAYDDVSALLSRLRERDIHLTLQGNRLRLNVPKGALSDELKSQIVARRNDLIAHLQSADRRTGDLRQIPRNGQLPISSAQRRLWFLDRMDPGLTYYNIGGALRYRGALDVELLRQAIMQLIARHEVFRTRISEHEGQPKLEILNTSRTPVNVVDLSDQPDVTREQVMRELAQSVLTKSFDMASGSLAAFLIVRLAPDDHALVISMHHAVSDGWSLAIAYKEISALYDASVTGTQARLAPLTIDYVDYAAWENEQASTGRFADELEYWKRQLDGTPTLLELPWDRPRPAIPTRRGGRVRGYLDSALIASLETCSRRHNATLFMTLMAAWQVLLHRYSGQDDIVVGTPVANRDFPALEDVIGCIVNNVVLRGKLAGNPTFAEFLNQMRQTTLAAFDHRTLPFDSLVQGLNPERSTSHAPIFQVMFTLMSFPIQSLAPAGLIADAIQLDSGTSRFDLTVAVAPVVIGEHQGKFAATYDYDSDLFDTRTIERLHSHFVNLLAAVAAAPLERIQDLPLLTPGEGSLLLREWNATTHPFDRERCLHHLLEASARLAPDALAVTSGTVALSYRALEQQANQLANMLRGRGVSPGTLVAVCLDRTVDLPIALAAVLKVGAAYVPLDPSHPVDRLDYILNEAGASCIITLSKFEAIFDGAKAPVLLLDREESNLRLQPATSPNVVVHPSDLAYVIYTSGSTGRPKGVEVEHRNVVNFLQAMRREPGLSASDCLLAVTTAAFDIANLEIWLPLSVGAHVVIASRTDALDGGRLIDLIETAGVTTLQATPTGWRLLLDAGWRGSRHLKALCGGEPLRRDLTTALIDRVGELWNMYGPTETTIWSTAARIADASDTITIGRPIANTRVFVLDQSDRLVPIGVVGELCIAGDGVARGYHNRPELTVEKFVRVSLPDGTEERVYRTGDMARYRADGTLECLGRTDDQVKIRGYRVELGEVEAALADIAAVKDCAATLCEVSHGDDRLVAYVTAAEGASFDAEALRALVRSRLPEYMVPNLFVVVAALPRTPNGKIDRKSLPAPCTSAALSGQPTTMLMSPTQCRVAEIWRKVLRAEHVGLHDNFFDLGGHSLLLVRLHAELKKEFASDMPLVELFQWTTVYSQADRMSSVSVPGDVLTQARNRAEKQLYG
jgi:amino acid adenylation domain-containing protein